MLKPDLEVIVHIKRPPHEVRAWWTDFPDEYHATDPKEQPHRIVVKRRSETERVMDTYWKVLGRETRIPETMRIDPHGDWTVDVALPFGLRQRDEFTLHPTADGTRVEIRVYLKGAVKGPYLALYGRASYRKTWENAARLCERDAPILPL